ncbi:MAG: Flp pilus assembly protein CpaB [Archangium sp.]|nr:Flp pilus assembly protein CpaB [Archangium sp.]
MEWRQDIRPARSGDADARDRLKEYLTPFVHGVCLAHAPHHVTSSLVQRVIDFALGNLNAVDDADVGAHVLNVARRIARDSAGGRLDELPSSDVGTAEALRVVSRLRELPEQPRERFFLRMLEGIPGPEIADVLRLTASELRIELERAASESARLLGQSHNFSGDDYLWELNGAPQALLARLEMQLPVLRFDPSVTAPGVIGVAIPDSAGTHVELAPVGASSPSSRVSTLLSPTPSPQGASVKKLVFDEKDQTAVGEVSTEPGVIAVAPPRNAPQPLATSTSHASSNLPAVNPFEPNVRTLAATDLPAEARGSIPAPQVPWDDPGPSSKSGRIQGGLPPRPVPAVGNGSESSGKSASGKSGRRAAADAAALATPSEQSSSGKKGMSSSGKFGMPSTVEVTKDAPKLTTPEMPEVTDAKVPAAIRSAGQPAGAVARQQQPHPGQQSAGSGPESILGKPTMEISLAQAVQGETRVLPLPLGASVTDQETRVQAAVTAPTAPPPTFRDASLLAGSSPLFIAGVLTLVGAALVWAMLFATEKQTRASWQLTEVVVAAEDLNIGDVVTLENVALRSVPEPFKGANVIKGDAMDFILDQKLAVAVQTGDPLFYSQFVSMRASRGLATRIMKRGRGYTIATSVTGSVGQWVKPGDSVDLIVTLVGVDPWARKRNKGNAQAQPIAFTVLQNVRVLATGKSDDDLSEATLDERDKAYGDVTLLLTAAEAEIVALSSNLGKITLTLRAEQDDDVDLERDRGYTNINSLIEGDRVKLLQKKRFAIIKMIRNVSPESVKNKP